MKVKPADMTPVEKDAFNSVLEMSGSFQVLSFIALHLSALDGAILPGHDSPPEQTRIEVCKAGVDGIWRRSGCFLLDAESFQKSRGGSATRLRLQLR